MTHFYGKYRGQVVNNIDPQLQGRLQVSVPAVLGSGTLSWAMPNAPYAGAQEGLFALPPIGANVWVEFEAGNPDYPIWAGCFWGIGEAPDPLATPFVKILQTGNCTIKVDDTPGAGGITIEANPPSVAVPARIALTSSGIEISCGGASVKLSPADVNINDGALQVI
jgi:hypothetical protein